MILTVILVSVAVVVVIKFFGPVLLDILAHLWDILRPSWRFSRIHH